MDPFEHDTIILWDTEYTCWEGCDANGWDASKNQFREFIQIAMLKINTRTMEVVGEFLSFVKPLRNPGLSDYCKQLTAISQDDIDGADHFDKVLLKMKEFVGDTVCFSFGRDFLVLYENLEINGLENPFTDQFVNIKQFFASKGVPIENYTSGTLSTHFGIKLDGHVHDAMDDVKSVLVSLEKVKDS